MDVLQITYLRFRQLFSILLILIFCGTLYSHGSVIDPPSRVYNCFLENPENPDSQGCIDAKAATGTQQFYDWPGVLQASVGGFHTDFVPDGQLASGGNPEKFGGLDITGDGWLKTSVSAGPYTVIWQNTAPHRTEYYRVYITTADWTPDMPLTWDKLELLADTGKRDSETFTNIPVVLPSRTGHHVIYSVWQRDLAFSQEAFYSTSDVDFGTDGGDNGDGGDSGSADSKVEIEGDFYLPTYASGMTDGQEFGLGIQSDGKIVVVGASGLSTPGNSDEVETEYLINKYDFSSIENKNGLSVAREGLHLADGEVVVGITGYLLGSHDNPVSLKLMKESKREYNGTKNTIIEVKSTEYKKGIYTESISAKIKSPYSEVVDNDKYIYYLEVEFCDECDFSAAKISTRKE